VKDIVVILFYFFAPPFHLQRNSSHVLFVAEMLSEVVIYRKRWNFFGGRGDQTSAL